MRDCRSLFDRSRAVRSQYGFDCRALLQCFPALVDMEEPFIRRRNVDESPYHLGVGNSVATQFVASATRTLSSRCAAGDGLPAETAGRDSSSPARRLFTPSQLSS